MNPRTLLSLLFIISFGLLSRLIPHLPNMTALNAIALLSPLFFSNSLLPFLATFSILFATDLILGLHLTMLTTYLSFFVIVCGGIFIRKKIENAKWLYLTLCSLFFYLLSNFGVWLSTDMYERTFEGLIYCYLAALPFLQYQWFGDLIYGGLLLKLMPYFATNTDSKNVYDNKSPLSH